MSELDPQHAVPPAGEEVHMPAPSLIPVINAAALAIAIVCDHAVLVHRRRSRWSSSWSPRSKWIADVRRDIADLPLEHHH